MNATTAPMQQQHSATTTITTMDELQNKLDGIGINGSLSNYVTIRSTINEDKLNKQEGYQELVECLESFIYALMDKANGRKIWWLDNNYDQDEDDEWVANHPRIQIDNLFKSEYPLYKKYATELDAQPAYLQINTQMRTARFCVADIGTDHWLPPVIVQGDLLQVEVPGGVVREELLELTTDAKFIELINQAMNAHTTEKNDTEGALSVLHLMIFKKLAPEIWEK